MTMINDNNYLDRFVATHLCVVCLVITQMYSYTLVEGVTNQPVIILGTLSRNTKCYIGAVNYLNKEKLNENNPHPKVLTTTSYFSFITYDVNKITSA